MADHDKGEEPERSKTVAGSEELVVQNEKDQKNEADNDSYGNQFLLFGPVAKNAKRETKRVNQLQYAPALWTSIQRLANTYRRIILDRV